MIDNAFLASQKTKSFVGRQTTPALRQLVFAIVDQVARQHYGSVYSIKCLQTAAAVKSLLSRLGIESQLWMGAVCAAEVFREPGVVAWGGFWDKDHHIWLATEFYEYVDLSISQLHMHPRRRRSDAIPMPPLWWSDIGSWPRVLKYLPDAPIHMGLECQEDIDDMKAFQAEVDSTFDTMLQHGDVEKVAFGAILGGPETMNALYEQGNEWVVRAFVFQERSIAFPDWIRDRETELIKAHQRGERAESRLSSRTDLVRTHGQE